MKDTTLMSVAAIVCITVLESVALVHLHINGILLTGVIAAIAAIGGHEVGFKRCEEKLKGS